MSDNEEGLYKEDSKSPRSNGELTPTSQKSDSPASDKFKSDASPRRSLSRSLSRTPSGSDSDRRRSYSRSRSRTPPPRYSRSRSGSYRRSETSGRRRDFNPRSRSRSPSPPYRSRGRGHGGPPRRRHVGDRDAPEPSRCLGVFGLGMYTQEGDLRDVFNRYGPIEDIQIVYDRQTSRSRGFGFIYFKNVDDAVEAKDRCNGLEVDGRRIRVDYSITERAHTPTPGVYLGKPSSERYRGYRSNNYYGGGGGGGGGGRRRSPSPSFRRRSRTRSRSRSWSPPRRY